MATHIAQWETAWVALAIALGLHVINEALTGFLPVSDAMVEGIRVRHIAALGLVVTGPLLQAEMPACAPPASWTRRRFAAVPQRWAGSSKRV